MLSVVGDDGEAGATPVIAATRSSQKPTQTQTHTRRRSASWNATFYSNTIVPALSDSNALSSFITSLTYPTDAAKSSLNNKKPSKLTGVDEDAEDIINQIALAPDLHGGYHKRRKAVEADFCPPPVAGYTTTFDPKSITRPKTLRSQTLPFTLFTRQPEPNLKTSKSTRDSQSLEPFYAAVDARSTGNISATSLPLSVNGRSSRTRTPFRRAFSSKLSEQHSAMQDTQVVSHKVNDASSGSQFMMESHQADELPRRFSAFVSHKKPSIDLDDARPDARTISPLNPSTRSDLSENLIPSRRSSLRSSGKRGSTSSKDLKSLNIDDDLIEENDTTVQRIRELQQAREKRHNEWRKEARKSEKAAKRASLPNSSTVQHTSSIRNSWHSRVTIAPEPEKPPDPSIRINGGDLTTTPASVHATDDEPLTPVEENGQLAELKRNVSLSTSTTSSLSSMEKHRKRLSESIKRSSSLRRSIPDDGKAVADEVEAFLSSPRLTQKIRHPRNGRTITFSEVGDPEGFVVICCVGMGVTRYIASFYDDIAKAQKLRIITLDRPGVGETTSMPEERNTPLAWVDDVAVICSSLGIEKFSLLAHSAGAIYALATALKMPQYVRGRIHLLAPWIPPSQLVVSGNGQIKAVALPTSHKLLSLLPASFMKAANTRFLSATNAIIEPVSRKPRKKNEINAHDLALDDPSIEEAISPSATDMSDSSSMLQISQVSFQKPRDVSYHQATTQLRNPSLSTALSPGLRSQSLSPSPSSGMPITPRQVMTPYAREKLYNTTLIRRTWSLATLNANPAADLITCLERRRPIGFRYTDITRSTVIHHGADDNRVPLENVRWLSNIMKRCELRVLEAEGHGLMASATVMSNVLAEIGKEWEEWSAIAKTKEKERLRQEQYDQERAKALQKEKRNYTRR